MKAGDKVKSSQYPDLILTIIEKDMFRGEAWRVQTEEGDKFYQPEENLTLIK